MKFSGISCASVAGLPSTSSHVVEVSVRGMLMVTIWMGRPTCGAASPMPACASVSCMSFRKLRISELIWTMGLHFSRRAGCPYCRMSRITAGMVLNR